MIVEATLIAQRIVPKLWGVEFWMCNEDLYCMKFLRVDPGFQCSIHAHIEKDETFIVCSGTLQLNLYYRNGSAHEVRPLFTGDRYRITPDTFHSFQSADKDVAWVMEVSTQHRDDDVIRLQASRKLQVSE